MASSSLLTTFVIALWPGSSRRVLTAGLIAALLSPCGVTDTDGDGWPDDEDCAPDDASIHPEAAETCDGIDEDCDGQVDDGAPPAWFYPDADGDRYGTDAGAIEACPPPVGYVARRGDCDDLDPAVHPGAAEVCNQADEDCDGAADDGLAIDWWPDADGDGEGAGEPDDVVEACAAPDGYSSTGSDCDDSDPAVNSSATEVCDDEDNDCDGEADDEVPTFDWWRDLDRDGFGDPAYRRYDCAPPAGYGSMPGDCDDLDPAVHPDAGEPCDGRDNDCNGTVDDGIQTWHPDADGDGFGSSAMAIQRTCPAPAGYRLEAGDCDDGTALAHPGAPDGAGDGVDSDCGGGDGPQPSVGLEASAFSSLQAALDAAAPDDTVWVGPGVYLEHDLTFRGKALTLASTHGSGNTVIEGLRSGPIMRFTSSETPDTRLDGFTLAGGFNGNGGGVVIIDASPTLSRFQVVYSLALEGRGGGIYLEGGQPGLRDCVISRNELTDPNHRYLQTSAYGGGMFVLRANPVIERCRIEHNELVVDGEGLNAHGGGLYLEQANPILLDTTISGNRLESFSAVGGGFVAGAGVFMIDSSPTLSGCVVQANEASSGGSPYYVGEAAGGGLYIEDSTPQVDHCRILDNDLYGQSYAKGGGIAILGTSSAVVTRSTIAGNRVASLDTYGKAGPGSGAGVHLEAWTLEPGRSRFSHCVIAGNGGAPFPPYGGGMYIDDASVEIRHCILSGNTGSYGGGLRVYLYDQDVRIEHSAIVGNSATQVGGGMQLEQGAIGVLVLTHSILAYNSLLNVDYYYPRPVDPPVVVWSDLYSEGANHNLPSLDSSNLTDEPGFLAYDEAGIPTDFHLSKASPLVDRGDPAALDADGTRADIGPYGGPEGDGWDLDGDGFPAWFWPGGIDEAPDGIDPGDYDADDRDAAVH